MDLPRTTFDFEFAPTEMQFGRNCVANLEETLADLAVERALVVCGSNVGANRETMAPIEAGLGNRLADVFDETTPEKTLETVLDGVDRMRAVDADGIVGLGGGSSLNVARAMVALDEIDDDRERLRERVIAAERIPSPPADVDPVPMVTIPTTLSGADVSSGGTIRLHEEATVPPGESGGSDSGSGSGSGSGGGGDGKSNDLHTVRVGDPRLFPKAIFYDQTVFASTPTGALVNSAMNGFNKGIETLYSRDTNPLSDAYAFFGLRHLARGIPGIPTASESDAVYDHLVAGIPLVQYGRFTNIIHTFGNGINHHYDVQQGVAHAIMVPAVLEYVFEHVDARRDAIAEALELDTDGLNRDAIAAAIVDRVRSIRDSVDLPGELRSVPGLEREHLPALAAVIAGNRKHASNPPGIDPSAEDIETILTEAW